MFTQLLVAATALMAASAGAASAADFDPRDSLAATSPSAYVTVSPTEATRATTTTLADAVVTKYTTAHLQRDGKGQWTLYLVQPDPATGTAGIVHVRAAGDGSNAQCVHIVNSSVKVPWTYGPGDVRTENALAVQIQCGDRAANPIDTAFQLAFSAGGAEEGNLQQGSFLLPRLEGASAPADTYTSTSLSPKSVGRFVGTKGNVNMFSVLHYLTPGGSPENIQVTSRQLGDTCSVRGREEALPDVTEFVLIDCLNTRSATTASDYGQFSLSVSNDANIIGSMYRNSDAHLAVPAITARGAATPREYRNRLYGASLAAPTVIRGSAPGVYTVRLPGQDEGIGVITRGFGMATPLDAERACSVQGPTGYLVGSEKGKQVTVICRDESGTPADSGFDLQFMTAQ
ncbi:hypothetical protein [Streptomyces sp. NPDC058701]|uniref:hypothetical protein n=1 Tax=Streptomyces sp. NPDC058701 TaxID=3346608 RepID=UPI003652E754